MTPVTVTRGDGPVILSLPHSGTWLPEEVGLQLNPCGLRLVDTDWYVDRLYEGLLPGATIVRANFHRYVVDANRDPSGASLYPGQYTTGLVPLTTFDNEPIWKLPPSALEIETRRERYHRPYHHALSREIERVRGSQGIAVVYDCHSIRSVAPLLFKGILPDLNIGTNNGVTCAPAFENAVAELCEAAPYTCVVNGRFRGGWTTRHYGVPARGVHAIQMEIAQIAYLATETAPFAFDEQKARQLRATLRPLLERIEQVAFRLAAEKIRTGDR